MRAAPGKGGLRAGEGATVCLPPPAPGEGLREGWEQWTGDVPGGLASPKLRCGAAGRVWGGQCRCCKSQPEPAVTSPISPDVFPRRLAELNIPQWALWGVSSLTSTRF